MSSYVDFSVKTRKDMKEWCMRELGYPLISNELTEEMLDQAINNSLELYTRFVIQEEDFIAVDLSKFTENGFQLPDNVTGVFSFEESGAMSTSGGDSGRIFSVTNTVAKPMMKNIAFGGYGSSWVDFTLAKQFLDLTNKMMGGGFTYQYNPRTKMLTLQPDPYKNDYNGYIVVGCSVIRDEDMQLGEDWVKQYALADAKEKIGTVRSKYEDVQLLGGGKINTDIREEGKEDKKELREKLEEMFPVHYFILG